MHQWLSLPVLVLIPLLGGFAMALMPRDRHGTVRVSALVISLIVFAINVVQACAMFDWGGAGTQLECDRTWIEPFGVSLSFGVDQISMLLVLLATFLMPLTILSSFRSVNDRVREFYMWLLVLEAAMIGVFISTDLILFYICFSQLEMHLLTIGKTEGIISEVFGGLNVILIVVRPMEFDFLTFIRNSVHPFLITA